MKNTEYVKKNSNFARSKKSEYYPQTKKVKYLFVKRNLKII